MEGGDVEVAAVFPAGVMGTTGANLSMAAAGERYEHTHMYPEFARVAEEEGFPLIAGVFRPVAAAVWKCRNCGYVYEGTEAPDKCPACDHPQTFFELLGENY